MDKQTGRRLLEPAREMLDRAQDIEALAQGPSPVFDLHLGTTVTIDNHLIPGLIARLRQRYPDSHIRTSRWPAAR